MLQCTSRKVRMLGARGGGRVRGSASGVPVGKTIREDRVENERLTWTVQQVLANTVSLGIPHFQRGLVWGDELKAALLESLYYDTPCGSFVLWQPADCDEYGVRIDAGSATPLRYLVIDGQQRIRSLHEIFRGAGDHKVWCINLAALPEFTSKDQDLQKRQRPLFVSSIDPAGAAKDARVPPTFRNLLPLSIVGTVDSAADPRLEPYRSLMTVDKATFSSVYVDVRRTVQAIQSREFWVSVQRDPSLARMVRLYNRINSAGKRVEVEERAFARLEGCQPGTYKQLEKAFKEMHRRDVREEAAVDPRALERDAVMKRQREQAFGFKLFIRVFMQVAQYHLGFPKGRTEFSFEIADRETFTSAFGALEQPQSDALWGVTHWVLGYVREVLEQELYCDDLRFLPDANSLLPAFQLLIHYPGMTKNDRYRPLMAVLIQRLFLAELDRKSILELIDIAGDHRTVALRAIARMLEMLGRRVSARQIAVKLQQARSLQHRYVLMMYWLERSRGARDLSYANVQKFKRKPGEEMAIDHRAEAQKQHMIPFSLAQRLYPDATRTSSHLVNSIGNLTYISADLNSWMDGGLGDLIADLALEDQSSRWAHLFSGSPSDSGFVDVYQALRRQLTTDQPSSMSSTERRRLFEQMTTYRRELLLAGMLQWMSDLEQVACKAFGLESLRGLVSLASVHDRVEPTRPMCPSPGTIDLSHLIRELGYPSDAEDHLIDLLSKGARPIPKGKQPWKDGEPPYRLQLTKLKKVWVKMGRAEARLRFDRSVPAAVRRQVCELLGLGPDERDDVLIGSVPSFAPLLEALPEIEKELAGGTKAS